MGGFSVAEASKMGIISASSAVLGAYQREYFVVSTDLRK